MASTQQQLASSGSEGDPRYAKYDEKKRKRMISNRDSARRSREKKQQHLEELKTQAANLKNENDSYSNQINATTHMYTQVASENNVLRAQVAELTDRLRSMNNVIRVASLVNGVTFDIQEIPEFSPEPWQLPFPVQPITASANVFPY